MKPPSIVPFELFANLRAGWPRQLLLGLFVSAVAAALFVLESQTAMQQLNAQELLRRAGASVYVVAPVGDTASSQLRTDICDDLNNRPQILNSGGLKFDSFVTVATAPADSLRLFQGTGRILQVLDPEIQLVGRSANLEVAASHEVARRVGINQGEVQVSELGAVHLDLFAPSLRHPFGDIMLVYLGKPRLVDECWFETKTPDLSAAASLASVAFDDAQLRISVRPVVAQVEGVRSPAEVFGQRGSRRGWLIASLAIAVPLILALWFSRQSSAIYRSLGVPRPIAAAILLGESIAVAIWGGAMGSLVGLIILGRSKEVSGTIVSVGLRSVIISVGVAAVLVVVGGGLCLRGRLTDQLKDR